MSVSHRRCVLLRGQSADTHARAVELLADFDPRAVAWIADTEPTTTFGHILPREVRRLLGRSFDAVVLDAHAGLDADVLGQSHGLVRGGGGFVLRMPAPGDRPTDRDSETSTLAKLAAFPYRPGDVGTRFYTRLDRILARVDEATTTARLPPPPPSDGVRHHSDQDRVVARLAQLWSRPGPSRCTLLADRGRGKSSALGLALARLRAGGVPVRAAVTGPHPEALVELHRFAGDPSEAPQFVPLPELVFGADHRHLDLIVVDEAAQLPVPMLRALVEARAGAHLCFATTTHGYEGTGRGFTLRFVDWLARREVAVEHLTLTQPIRWDAGDPLEALVFDALLLDAEPAKLDADAIGARARGERAITTERLDRDVLLADETTVRELFGLLVHAHYRTSPGDLHRLLDAPNLDVSVLRLGGRVVAATIVAHEGELPASLCDELVRGARRIRAHALPEVLVAHLGKPDAGRLRMLRSVRVATHPQLRRRGLATRLVEHVHREHAPELFGTLFGATPELLSFRRSLGYELVRVSASRGARAGEPSVMMLRPASPAAHALIAELRAELARDLPRLLELMHADGETLLEPALVRALLDDLPAPAPLSAEQSRELAHAYAHGPRTFESVAVALARFVDDRRALLDALTTSERRLIEARVLDGLGWRRVAAHAGTPGVPAAMRALRRAIRRLTEL